MPAHRSPGGTSTTLIPQSAPAGYAVRSPARHSSTPASAARRVGTTTAAAGAAFGVVASGAFAAIIPTNVGGTTEADASTDVTKATMLASQSAPIASSATSTDGSPSGYFSPVAFDTTPAAAHQAGAPTATASDVDVASLDKAGKIAEKIAAEHEKAAAAEAKKAAARKELDSVIAAGGLDGWIAEALDHMGLSQSYATGLKRIILKESNGDPDAINNWDSNAAAGNHSEGLMQVIPATFKRYVHPDFANESVTDPVANITAGVRYMIDRYGLETLAAGGRSSSSGGYLGY
ncbi:transglycosylase-like protein with SLT domain [Pseudonocardia sediminis]|uniref:Transglycosylase-like protein with SLT domain n=1 Tax=Pseudonocardia sediminis TaxID=1397368 RepID=A0A4Q7UQT3_PSEST|nr:transglycosylase SLT domain-containing protein [Pseudonocardia sediminis]RZT84177.1 transglycosylase-like protein with SLT domain [Pseudonocardia sediminis]